jgi:adenosylcobinamide-GDP ribazoletransferase
VIGAVGFLTVLGRPSPPGPASVPWFPAVGAAVGGLVGLIWWGAAEWWPLPVAAGLAVAADLALTGLLHIDGLADAADGLLPPMARDRRLAAMAAPDIGAFGVGVVGAALLLRFASLASMDADVALLAALWCAARTAMALALTRLPYAREEGLASPFRSASPWPATALGALLVTALALGDPARVGASAVAVLAGAALVLLLGWRRLGGFTGDVLGAAGLAGETVGLVVAAGRW